MQLKINDHPINYEIHGEGVPIILLPGWTMSARALAYMVEPAFATTPGWQRIYIDPPGHGWTPGADRIENLDDMLDLLLAVVDALIGNGRFLLLGYSLGAYLARGILYHRIAQVVGLGIAAPAIITIDKERNVPAPTVIIEDPGIMDLLHEDEKDLFSICTVRTDQFLSYLRSFPQPAENGAGDMEFLEGIRQDPEKYRFSFAVDQLNKPFPGPSLIITGRQDPVVGYKDAWDILENYPRATFIVTDRTGHLLEEKNEFAGFLIREWLARVKEYLQS